MLCFGMSIDRPGLRVWHVAMTAPAWLCLVAALQACQTAQVSPGYAPGGGNANAITTLPPFNTDSPNGTVDPTGTPSTSPNETTPVPYQGMLKRYDWVGILGAGQSLSVGWTATAILDGAPSVGHNLELNDSAGVYDITNPNASTLSVVALKEPVRPIASTTAYPRNIAGESPHTAMGQQISADAMAAGVADPVTVHSVTGLGGQGVSVIGKGGTGNAYAAGIFEAQAFARLAQQAGKKLGYGAIVLTHGEADATNPNYQADLLQMWSDYNGDLKAITQQNDTVPLILSQQNTEPTDNVSVAQSMLAQWRAAIAYPGQIILAGPKTQYGYSSDQIHLPASGYRRMGIKYAEVYSHVVEQGLVWKPLQPSSVALPTSQDVDIQFDVPYPPLVWDDAQPLVHQQVNAAWAQGQGFEVLDANGQAVTIASATISTAENKVTLHLSAAVTPPLTVQYAMTQDVVGQLQGGLPGGRIGHLRDSDNYVGYDAADLSCSVTHGSATITCATGLASRALYDIVTPAAAQVIAFNSATTATLSAPWSGSSGAQTLHFRSNQYNYCVSFSLRLSP